MTPKRKPWPDVPRLLKMRQQIESALEPGVATSVTAFLSWKAFLITARATGMGGERERCCQSIAEAINSSSECRITAGRFSRALQHLTDISNVALGEWFLHEDEQGDIAASKLDNHRRALRKLSTLRAEDPLPLAERFSLAEFAYLLRNAVLAHGAVHSTGNLFQVIVPSFDQLVATVACQLYSVRAGLAFSEAADDCALTAQ